MRKIFFCLIAFIMFSGCTQQGRQNPQEAQESTACFPNGKCISIEVADSADEREQGLMFRRNLSPGTGVLFVFESPGQHGFWMKNTLIPLDIIWMDAQGIIVGIFENAQPCGTEYCPIMAPELNASLAVEVNAGMVQENRIQEGERVILRYNKE